MNQVRLRDAIGAEADAGDFSRHRGDVDDPSAATFDHIAGRDLCTVPEPLQVNRERALNLLQGRVQEGLGGQSNAGAIDQDIEAAKFIKRPPGRRFDVLELRHIDAHRERPHSQRLDLVCDARGSNPVDIPDGDTGPLLPQPQGTGAPDPRPSPCDYCSLSGEGHPHLPKDQGISSRRALANYPGMPHPLTALAGMQGGSKTANLSAAGSRSRRRYASGCSAFSRLPPGEPAGVLLDR